MEYPRLGLIRIPSALPPHPPARGGERLPEPLRELVRIVIEPVGQPQCQRPLAVLGCMLG